jgi:hypothetical protein
MFYLPKERECFKKRGSNGSVFGDLCQRGREHEHKAKGPRTAPPPIYKIFWFLIGTNFRKSFSIGMIFNLVSPCVLVFKKGRE